ncbi:beta strand repeat-containing protein [Marmoricola sp. RAF53]|uniref:beta strand repeat-containing protein n=1 Tax=Marmoricola sp. RAF53 TaxID=3233059 RepID=UPI003F97DFF4
MRRFTAAAAAAATALGLALVAVSPADASITSPNNGSVVGGILTMSDTGATDSSSLCITGSSAQTQVRLFNSANTAVFNQTKSGAGAASFTFDTHTVPNGAYKVQTDVRNKSGTIFCSNSSSTFTSNITITNTVAFTYGGPASAAQNTVLPLTFTVTDPNNANAPLSGFTLNLSLTGGGTTTATSNAQGVVSANLPISGPPRTGATLTVSYAGTTFWAAKTINVPFDVTKNDTSVTVAQPAPVVHGQATSFSATVAPANGTTAQQPTGTVTFSIDGAPYATAPLAGNTASSPSISTLSTGDHTITATYNGDGNYFAGNSAAKTQVVGKADTSTVLTRDPDAGTVSGQAVTFTAKVAVTGAGAGAPTGGVQFNVDGQPFGTAVPLSGDEATLTISNLLPGNHDVVAVYNGDADFKTSSAGPLTHGVNKANSNLVLTGSAPGAVSGQPITYTAVLTAVAPGAGTPTGQVQFTVDGNPLGAPVNLVNGQATSPVANLQVYSHLIAANYLGDVRFGGSNDSLTQNIAPAHTTTALTTSPNPSVFGQAVTLHAEVTPDAPATGAPEGAIRFRIDGGVNNGGQDLYVDTVGGAATASISSLSVGSHSVVATYLSGDLNFTTSSDSETQVVNKAATKTVVSSSATPSVFGQPVTLTAAVSVLAPGAGAPSGTVVFTDGSDVLATVPVSSATGFQASFTTDDLSVGQHAITATFSGDESFQGSNGTVTQTVKKAQTTTVVTSSNNPALTGQGTVFTAVVAPVAPGAGVPTGTVQFTVNGLPLGGGQTLVNGVATSPGFASLVPGTYKVKAVYSGETNFVTSNGLLDQGNGQNVTKGQTSLAVSSDAANAAYNAPVTFTATVSAVAPATGKPSGVVRFWEGDVLLGSNSLTPASSGNTASADFVTTTLAPGAHAVRAEYVGNFNFAVSQGQTSVTIGRVPTVVGVSSSANPIVFGSPVTLKATVSESLPAEGEPTGSVTFKEGSTVLGTGTISTVGGEQVATATVSGLTGGAHAITAVYSGDTVFANSTSAGLRALHRGHRSRRHRGVQHHRDQHRPVAHR